MDSAETELQGRVARLFERRPDLWRFTVPEAKRLLPGRTFMRALH